MPVTLPKLLVLLCVAASALIPGDTECAAQSGLAKKTTADSSSLPDAPAPQTTGVSPGSANTVSSATEDITLAGAPRRFFADQKAIWTSPLHIRPLDAIYLLPLGAATGVLIGSDHHTMTSLIHINTVDQNHFSTLSTAGVVALGALPASMYLYSLRADAPQAHETGLLAGEALADSLVVSEALKVVTRRDRPLVNNAQGDFFSSSATESSFPSNHAIAAWSLASVVGEEYPGWLSRTVVYGGATAVSVSRVLAERHFPSDVLVGSATGYLIGHYVYNKHHNYSLNPFDSTPMPGEMGAPRKPRAPSSSSTSPVSPASTTLHYAPDPIANRPPRLFDDSADPDSIGSPNVPMDSWVYPALERLAAMGFIPGQSVSIRPWTRQECLRQLKIAKDLAGNTDDYSQRSLTEAMLLMRDLEDKFEREPDYYESLDFESAYARYGTIAGPALADSFHFGQTWWNDFGRPLGRGSSAIAGFSVRAHAGRLFFFDRQEEQHDPGNPAETPAVNALINTLDTLTSAGPFIAPIPLQSAYNRQRPLELYAGVALAGNALSLGKQELYWGPTTMGPLAFSSNAEPTYNLRFVATRPHPFPFFPTLGTYRFDVVLGKLSGHSYPARPWFNGQKADLNLGNNLEISFTRWSVFWGVGHPITLHSLRENLFSLSSTGGGTGGGSGLYGDRTDPGDRKSNFDFNWHLPFLSRVVTLYADAYSDDDLNPIDAPRRAVWNPGVYFARLPFLPHMDLRVEAVSSEGLFKDFGGQHYFINGQYEDSNTNKGFLLGNAIGRDARAIEGRSGYWFSARTRVEAGYRQNKGGTLFLPGGGTITDGFVNGSYAFNQHWQVQTFTQYERFLIPSYLPGSQHNTSGWVSIVWNPELNLHR